MIPFSFQLPSGDKGFVWQYEEGEGPRNYSYSYGLPVNMLTIAPYTEKLPNYDLITFERFFCKLIQGMGDIYDDNISFSHLKSIEITYGEQKIDSTESLHSALRTVISTKTLASQTPLFTIKLNLRIAPIQGVESAAEQELIITCNRLALINGNLLQSLVNHSLGHGKCVGQGHTLKKEKLLANWRASFQQRFIDSALRDPEQIIKAINKLLSLHEDSNGRELLLVDDKFRKDGIIDWDIANVIEMVINRHHTKKGYCLVLSSVFFPILALCKSPLLVNKLSFLSHGGHQHAPYYNQENIALLATLAKTMPLLDIIVLRQCFASGDYALDAIKFNPELFKPRYIQQVGKHGDIEAKDLGLRQFLLQQQMVDNRIITKVRYYDISGSIISQCLEDIPQNLASPSISCDVEQALAVRAKSHKWPPLIFSANKMAIDNIHKSWKNNIPLSPADKQLYKASDAKASTFKVEEFPPGNAASYLLQQLAADRDRVSIKAYYGWYNSFFPCVGVINSASHGYKDRPKALCVSPSP